MTRYDDDDDDLDDMLARRRRKRRGPGGVSQVGWLLIGVAVVAGIGWAAYTRVQEWRTDRQQVKAGRVPPGGVPDGVIVMDHDTVNDFGDWPERYKGKTVEIKATYVPLGHRFLDTSVRTLLPNDLARFGVAGRGDAQFTFSVSVPKADVPEVRPREDAWVRFVCESGDRHQGNRGLQIRRP